MSKLAQAPLTQLPLTRLAAMLRAGEISAVELTQAHLDRIHAVDGRLNAYMVVMAESALAEARTADAAARAGKWLGPLHGIPVGIKDLMDVAGVPNTFGSAILRENVPSEDAELVRRLRAAGAVMIGKQGMHEFAFGVTSENPHYGAIHNPWDLERVPGGSSGGTAAAIAAGLCVVGIGSDTGGSIRIPAALCGLAGIKPTFGRVSRRGALPLAWSLDHMGPLARSVADLAVTLQAIAGFDPQDPNSADQPVPDFSAQLEQGVKGLRLGVVKEHFWSIIEPDVADAVRGAIGVLADLGAEVEEVSIPTVAYAQELFTPTIGPEAASWHELWLKRCPELYGADVHQRLALGATTPAMAYLKAQRIRVLLQQEFAAALRQFDGLLTPTMVMTAAKIGETTAVNPALGVTARAVSVRNTCPANLAGLPAVTVPCGLVRGLPVGLQVIGDAWAEPMILRIAREYEQASGWAADGYPVLPR